VSPSLTPWLTFCGFFVIQQLLEQSPFNDADDSLFEEEKYGIVSALLGERAQKFLNIPTGPIQVAHFVGALVIVLMAFVEYPGFPLTNLPTPIRDAFQGGKLDNPSVRAGVECTMLFRVANLCTANASYYNYRTWNSVCHQHRPCGYCCL
jgi:hypothetical protein